MVVEAQAKSWYADSPIGLLVLRYAEANALLRDQRLDHNGKRYLEMNGVFDGPIYDWFVPMIVNHDGADHHRLRGLVGKAFTPRMINGLRPFIRAKAQQLTDELASVEVCEFIADFGNPLPLAVMCELLGVPAEDYDTFRVWTTDVGLVFSLAHGGDIRARVEAALVGLTGYVDALMTAKAATPGDDLISALVVAQRDDGRVSRAELANLIVTLVFAAHDSTRHQLANAMVAFARHPEQWDLLAARPELADQAVEEVIRWIPTATTLYRFAAQDFDYQGLHIAKDTFITMCVTIAQRDPRVFADGARFDITAVRPGSALLQFGAGPHHCLGAALARAEMSEALPVLAARLGPPVIDGPLTWRPPIGIHGPNALPLRFGRRD
ncbi:cytochrome P450 [Actinocrispum wychmicini]|uniref:cytochrome P450 n=1 Tax=Actinocrispum wychmicini TaxID=1213861 RepID=UPI001FB5EF1E|nr:cytochrome P450 [Actinocrispum wychmicini]